MSRSILAALACLVLAALAGAELTSRREAAGIPVSPARVPLGGFEPLAVNLLWLRAEAFREEGRLTESATAYRLVTELQPHIGSAWSFPAWILAWTEAGTGDAERQWRWVRPSIEMLERGLEWNPGNGEILLTLGFVYYRRLAREPEIYGLARERLGRRPEEAAIEVFTALADALPNLNAGPLADSWRLLGERRLAEGDRDGARAAFAAALPIWRRLAAETGEEGPARIANEIETRLGSLR